MNRQKILEAIDMGEWKNSWHLQKDEYGNKIIDASVIKTIEEMVFYRLQAVQQLLEARSELTDSPNQEIIDHLQRLLKCSTISLNNVELVLSGTEIVGVRVKAPTH